MPAIEHWRYTARVDVPRRERLAEPGSFDAVVARIADDMQDLKVEGDPGRCPGLTDCVRPVFSFDLPSAFDVFFNSPWGYRAQYWHSAFTGLAANAALLDALRPALLKAEGLTTNKQLTNIDICAALSGASAKIWVDEATFPWNGLQRDLDIARWALEADNNVDKATWGLSAPEHARVKVFGAFIDPHGNEVVAAGKIRRHWDIYHYGFS